MMKKKSAIILHAFVSIVFIVLLAFPVQVFAEGDVPTDTPVPTESTAVPTEPTAVPAEPTAVPAEPPAATAEPTAVPAEPTAVPTEPPAATAETTAVPAETTTVPTEPPVTEADPTAVPIEAPTIAETVDALQTANVVIVDESGDPIPLASIEAAATLTAPDPIGCPAGITPTWMGGTGVGCTSNYTSVQAAVSDAMVVDGWTVYIQAGNYYEQVSLTKNVSLYGYGNAIIKAPAVLTSTAIGGVDNYSLITVSGTSNTLITGLTLDGLGASIAGVNPAILAGITFNNASGTVLNTLIQNFSDADANQEGVGVVVYNSNGVDILNNTITKNETGVLIQDSKNTRVRTNKITDNTNIGVKVTENTPNLSTGIEIGSHATNGNDAKIGGNDIFNNTNYNMWENISAAIHAYHDYFGISLKIYGFGGADELDKIENNEVCNGGNNCKGTIRNECSINDSDKFCCPGMVCVLFNKSSLNGKCCLQGQVIVDGECVAGEVMGCTDPKANNYDPKATVDDGSCKYDVLGCTDPKANNYDPKATVDDGSCKYDVLGCTDKAANNYDPKATKDDGSCKYGGTTILPFVIPVTGVYDIITAGVGHTCAITAKTGLRCWGENDFGQLGNGSNKNSALPVAVKLINPRSVLSLVAGSHHTCALLSSGEVMCWGLDESGQLGDGTNVNRNTPVKVKGLKGKITSLTAGAYFTCAMNDANETMCWGDNSMGQLVNDSTQNSNTAVLSKLSGIKLLSGGFNELQAVTTEGILTFFSNLPAIPVTGAIKDVALVSGDRFDNGGCALDYSGRVECWGSIKGTVTSGAQLTNLLSSGQNHACLQTSKGLHCWGANSFGQLGDGTHDDSESPVIVQGIQSVIGLAAGAQHTCVIVDPETIKCWGSNAFGQLGNGTLVDSQVPVFVK